MQTTVGAQFRVKSLIRHAMVQENSRWQAELNAGLARSLYPLISAPQDFRPVTHDRSSRPSLNRCVTVAHACDGRPRITPTGHMPAQRPAGTLFSGSSWQASGEGETGRPSPDACALAKWGPRLTLPTFSNVLFGGGMLASVPGRLGTLPPRLPWQRIELDECDSVAKESRFDGGE